MKQASDLPTVPDPPKLSMTMLPSIIPCPHSTTLGSSTFRLDSRVVVLADELASGEARYLSDALGLRVGTNSDSLQPCIELRIDPTTGDFNAEGYRMRIDPTRIDIAAPAAAGLFYGIQTLLQLLPADLYGAWRTVDGEYYDLRCLVIEDAPRFRWRGAMLDVSRHFLPCEFVLKFIDLLALHKLNVLHLHLTDDQGWRIEIKKYPLLTSVGSLRSQTVIGSAMIDPASADFDAASQQFDGVPYGGFYTQEQARAIVGYAAARHITIVPEIEMPGHAQAAIAAYPYLGSSDQPMEVSPTWGIHDALYKPTERTFEFLQGVLAEIMEIFPSRFIHVGGDEAVKTQWRNSPECQAIMRELGLRDEAEMQSYFIKRIDEWLTGRGRVLIGWDEILEGGLAPGAVVMSWRGEQGGIDAAQTGHDVVMAPYQATYLDYYQSDAREREPLAFASYLPLATVYNYEPIPAGLPAEYAGHILGAQCQLWSEYMPSPEQVEYQAFPRLTALAELTWTKPENKDYAGFLDRLRPHLARLDALGVNYRRLDDD